MIFFIIACMILFVFSLSSNIIFVLTTEETRVGGVIGMILFTAMIVWGLQLIISNFH